MKVLLWQCKKYSWSDQLVLWDGQNTYWTTEMKPSSGYTKIVFNRWAWGDSRFVLLGYL